ADPVFWQSLKNNLLFALGTIPTSIALALAMALLVNGKLRGRAFLRLSYFTPTILPMIAVANIWLFFFTPGYGLLEQVTGLFGLVNAVINSFRLVDHIVVMTRGGPDNASQLLLYYIYDVGFKFWDTAYAAALTMVLLVILAAFALGQFVLLDRRVHYRRDSLYQPRGAPRLRRGAPDHRPWESEGGVAPFA